MPSLKEYKKKELGPLKTDGKPWSQADFNLFLDQYLNGVPTNVLCHVFGRSESSLVTILWKLTARYRGLKATSDYRAKRSNKPWRSREITLLQKLVAEGFKLDELAVILGRTATTIARFLNKMTVHTKQQGFGL